MHREEQSQLAHYIRQNMSQAGYSDSEIDEEIAIAESDIETTYQDLVWICVGLLIASGLSIAAIIWVVLR